MSRAIPGLIVLFAAGCSSTICDAESDSHDLIDDFWATLDREYAVFDVRLDGTGRTWEDIGLEACEAVSADSSEDAAFDALVQMARALNDGHIQFEADDREADGWATVWPYEDEAETFVTVAEDRYVDSAMRSVADGAFAWGRIGRIGYLSITRLDDFSEPAGETSDIFDARDIMEEVLLDLDSTDGMIIDLRANEGGWDTVAVAIAETLAGPEAVAWSKAQRNGPDHTDFTRFRDITLEASGPDAYDAPVVALTSGLTFSAGETLVLALRVRSDVTVVGERTSGHFSDLYEDELWNGWLYTYSGDRYRAADGVIYEGTGVPPDVEVAFDPESYAEGTDTMLEAALELLDE